MVASMTARDIWDIDHLSPVEHGDLIESSGRFYRCQTNDHGHWLVNKPCGTVQIFDSHQEMVRFLRRNDGRNWKVPVGAENTDTAVLQPTK